MITPTFQVNVTEFNRRLEEFVQVSGQDFIEALRQQCRLLGKEIIQRTPPMDGKSIKRMVDARGYNRLGGKIMLSDPEISSMKARIIGERRVEKDINKIIFGLKKDEAQAAKRGVNFGRIQKCNGRIAVRLFATKRGEVYGTDFAMYQPNASEAQLKQTHYEARTKRGRVSRAGQSTLDIGRWKWINLLVTKDAIKKRYIKLKQKMVGEAKGGWVSAMNALGANISVGGWPGRHYRAGTYKDHLRGESPSFTFINNSHWASANDPDRIIEQSMRGRAKAMASHINQIISKNWKKRVKKEAA